MRFRDSSEKAANDSMYSAQMSFERSMNARNGNASRSTSSQPTNTAPRPNYQNQDYQDAQQYQRPQQNAYRPQQPPRQPYQSQYQQPQPPRKKHHYKWVIVVLLICAGFGGFYMFNSGKPQKNNSNQPRVVKKTVTNNYQQPAKNLSNPVKQSNLEHEMQALQMAQSEQQRLINAYERQAPQTQDRIYDKVQHYERIIPSTGLKRRALHAYLNEHFPRFTSNTNNNQQ